MAIEYQLPQSSKRIDFVITGENAARRGGLRPLVLDVVGVV